MREVCRWEKARAISAGTGSWELCLRERKENQRHAFRSVSGEMSHPEDCQSLESARRHGLTKPMSPPDIFSRLQKDLSRFLTVSLRHLTMLSWEAELLLWIKAETGRV